jgi:hypothetical protein
VLNKWKTDRPASVLHDLLARRVVCDEDDSVVVLVSVFSVLEELVDALFVVVHLLPLFLVSEAEDEQLVSVVFQHLRDRILLLLDAVEVLRISDHRSSLAGSNIAGFFHGLRFSLVDQLGDVRGEGM